MSLASLVSVKLGRPRRVPDLTLLAIFGLALLISLIILAQLGVVLWLSWRMGSPGTAAGYGWKNYVDIFTESMTLRTLANTLEFSSISLAVALLFGVPIAWLVERTDIGGKSLIFTSMTVSLVIPGFATAIGWLFLLHPRIGVVNVWLERAFGLSAPPLNVATLPGMGFVQGLSLAPVAFIMTAAVFRAMDPALEEAALMSGATFLWSLRRITLPLAWPGIMAAALYIFTIGFAAFDIPAIIGWSNRIFTFSTYIYLLIDPQDVLPRYGPAAALSTFMLCLAAALSWLYASMQRRSRRYAVIAGKAYRPRMVALGAYRTVAAMLVGLYLTVSNLVPILLLTWSALLPFFQPPSKNAFAMLSLSHFRNQPWNLIGVGVRNTATLMILTPTISLAFALALSWIVLRSKYRWRSIFDVIAFMPHAVPNIVFGVGALLATLYVLQRAVPIYGTVWLLLFVYAIVQISYATRMTNSGLIQVHPELEECAQICGATLGQTFRRILLPLLAPTLLYAWLWVALLVYRELTLAVILSTGRNMTLPVVIWSIWLGGGLGEASALVLIMLACMLPLIAAYWIIARRQGALGRA